MSAINRLLTHACIDEKPPRAQANLHTFNTIASLAAHKAEETLQATAEAVMMVPHRCQQ